MTTPGPKTRALISTLGEIATLLDERGAAHWAAWCRRCAEQLERRDFSGVTGVLGGYGGMGSFGDLVLSPANGHRVEAVEVEAVNRTLSELRSRAHALASELKREGEVGDP